ncbi:EFR1 family ferrodoxin [Desulfosporosinus sp. PR]|uniref:EFR1 family ferrodoxin n=1 Tax=Candidatus Desulfosporosinus nitrosoreducens TaxID=3401928 RepID=UPI0027E7B4BB|nr:EFR1 family ferrodoxin [Desulfosporosinus sp. PR]MDQ7093253.1 EFR1 family ferrodoxin [Desulfosporosinus sp. PR]
MQIFYFTGTGNSLYVAKSIGREIHSIPGLLGEGTREFKDDAIGFVFPCYCFGLPRSVIEFISQSKFSANYYFAVMTYGNIAASGLKQMEEIGAKAGIQFNYTNEILMVDNYLPGFDVQAQLQKEKQKNIEGSLKKIVQDIQARKNSLTRKGIVSNILSKVTYIAYKYMVDSSDKKFIVQDSCNGCKICAKVCPKNNIVVERKPRFLHTCDSCYACIHHCPQNALHLKSEKSNERFINQNITLKEIIDTNNAVF